MRESREEYTRNNVQIAENNSRERLPREQTSARNRSQTETILSRISRAMHLPARRENRETARCLRMLREKRTAGESSVSWHLRGRREHLRDERVFSCEIFVNIPLYGSEGEAAGISFRRAGRVKGGKNKSFLYV